jgi:xylulokinase
MYLGLDLGTTNVKAVVASEAGKVLGEASRAVRLIHRGHGGVEQDIEEIWRAAVMAIRQATKRIRASGIRAVGISSQGGALQMQDKRGKPKGRVISWLDQRGGPFDRALTEELGKDWFVERVGHRGAGLAVGHLMRLKPKGRIGFVGDVVVGRCAAARCRTGLRRR